MTHTERKDLAAWAAKMHAAYVYLCQGYPRKRDKKELERNKIYIAEATEARNKIIKAIYLGAFDNRLMDACKVAPPPDFENLPNPNTGGQ